MARGLQPFPSRVGSARAYHIIPTRPWMKIKILYKITNSSLSTVALLVNLSGTLFVYCFAENTSTDTSDTTERCQFVFERYGVVETVTDGNCMF